MRAYNQFMPASIFLCAVVVLTGCTKAGSQFGPATGSVPEAKQHANGARPANCTPTVWASSLTANRVYGYTAANSPPCVTLHGSYAGLHFHGPYGIAIGSSPNYLYVADIYNNRVVVFDANGNYVKWLNTKLGGTNYEPWGVCVSSGGTVGVGTIQEGAAQGDVQFFPPNAASGSLATGDATGQLQRQTYCTFDSAGNFFVDDGSSSGTSHIDYLASSNVGMPGQTLVDSGLGVAVWAGMYSRINDPEDRTLSVATDMNFSTHQHVYTWLVGGPATGPLTFTACTCSPYNFHGYPSVAIPVNGVAPSVGGASGVLYFADYGKDTPQGGAGKILQGPATGGLIAVYQRLHGVVGVATNPTGSN